MSGPWSVPAGSTGSLPPGCHAYPLLVECLVLQGEARTEKIHLETYLEMTCVQSCICSTHPRYSIKGLWEYIIAGLISSSTLLKLLLNKKHELVCWFLKEKVRPKLYVSVWEPGCGPCVVCSILQVCSGPETLLRWEVHYRSTLQAERTCAHILSKSYDSCEFQPAIFNLRM